MSGPWADFTDRVQPDAQLSCWPVPEGAKECRNGHPLSRRQTDRVPRERVDHTTGEILTDPRTGQRLWDWEEYPAHMPFPRSSLEITGLAAAPCECGLPIHPLTGEAPPIGHSFIRVSYLRAAAVSGHRHVVPLPPEATTPRGAA